MEQLVPPAHNPHLKRVLKSYWSSANNSLSGPSSFVSGWGDPSKLSPTDLDEYHKAIVNGGLLKKATTLTEKSSHMESSSYVGTCPCPVQRVGPLFLPMDRSGSDKSDTILEGEKIACFIVGGEKRLCLPQILNTVLRDFSLPQINAVCDELHIFCSRCNPEQLDVLKAQDILPYNAPSCGLITKTDAERLCNALLHSSPEKSREAPSPNSFKVYHECFGKCKGVFSPELYVNPYAKCIRCVDCHGMFAPQKFVCHSGCTDIRSGKKKESENRTCHWGFDSANWRSYLLLAKDQDLRDRCQLILDELKAKFDCTNRYKRREGPHDEKEDGKRARYEETTTTSGPKSFDSSSSSSWSESQLRGVSAFRPWSPSMLNALKEGKAAISVPTYTNETARTLPSFLHTGPPVLLNPERVIPLSESSRYERHFAPNVSLAPQPHSKSRIAELIDEQDAAGKTRTPLPPKHNVDVTRDVIKDEETLDIESSDTEESSLRSSASSSSVPSTPRTSLMSPSALDLSHTTPTSHDMELELVRRALDGEVGEDSREVFMDEYRRVLAKREDKMAALVRTIRDLQQELEYVRNTKKERLRAATEDLRKDIERLKSEGVNQEEERKHLQTQLEQVRQHKHHPDIIKVKQKYRMRIEGLQKKLRNYEHDNQQLKLEVAALREEYTKMNKEAPDFKYTPPPDDCVITNGGSECETLSEKSFGEKDVLNGSKSPLRKCDKEKMVVVENGHTSS